MKVYTEDSVIINAWYWSHNQFSAVCAWPILMNHGYINAYNNKTATNRVRAISSTEEAE